MQYSSTILLAAFAITNVAAHGVITEVQGANGKPYLVTDRYIANIRTQVL